MATIDCVFYGGSFKASYDGVGRQNLSSDKFTAYCQGLVDGVFPETTFTCLAMTVAVFLTTILQCVAKKLFTKSFYRQFFNNYYGDRRQCPTKMAARA